MQTICLLYPARQRICWIQDSLSPNWTHDVRRFAANNKIQFVPTPTYASYLTESRTTARLRVRRQQHRLPDWHRPARHWTTTSPTAMGVTPAAAPPPSNPNTEAPA
jgi:hypothetical protein